MIGAPAWMVYGYRSLGASRSPWVTPLAGGRVVPGGAYGIVRRPIYTGWIGLGLGSGFVTSSALAVRLSAVLATGDLLRFGIARPGPKAGRRRPGRVRPQALGWRPQR